MFDPITSEILSSLCWAYIEDTNRDEAKRQQADLGWWVGGVGGVGLSGCSIISLRKAVGPDFLSNNNLWTHNMFMI